MLGEGFAGRSLALEACHRGGLRSCDLGQQLILGGRGLQLFQLQLKLIQSAAALGMRAEVVAVKLDDLQLQMGDQGGIVGAQSALFGQLSLGEISPDLGGRERRLERFEIVRCGLETDVHDHDGITKIAACGAPKCRRGELFCAYPALVGRQLICGLRQSIPSSR